MKRILPLLVAISAPSLAHAATPDAPTAPAPDMAAQMPPQVATLPAPTVAIDPAAATLLDESGSAYAKLSGFSAHFATYDSNGDKTNSMSGNISFARPGKAKLDVSATQISLVVQTEGEKIFSQMKPKVAKPTPAMLAAAKQYQSRYAEDGEPIQAVLQQIPSALSVVLPSLVAGNNPLGLQEMHWLSASVLDTDGVRLTIGLAPGVPPLVLRLYFDQQDKLLRRVEAEVTVKGKKTLNLTTLTNVQTNPEFAADTFTFTPATGSKEIAEPANFNPKLRVGAAPIALTGKDLSGKTHPWSDYAGKVVLLDFWASRFPPSTDEIPNILQNLKTYHEAGFEVIGVSLDQDKASLQAFLKQNSITYPQIFDGKMTNNADVHSYGLNALPFSILIGKDGKIAAINPRGAKLEPAIVKALAN